MHRIREPINSLPSHMTEIMCINDLVSCVVLKRIGETDVNIQAAALGRLEEWVTTHRPNLMRCSRVLNMSFGDLMRGADTPHESAIESLDGFVALVVKGLSEDDMTKYITDESIEQARFARKEIERCETKLIHY